MERCRVVFALSPRGFVSTLDMVQDGQIVLW